MQTELYLHVFAPVMVAFTQWVLREAEASGRRRLYFLARDGYPMYLAARMLCAARNIAIECRYLKVSRYSLRVPSYYLMKEECLERICIDGMNVSFETVMKRAALTEKEGRTLARLMGYEERIDKNLKRVEILKLKKELYDMPDFLKWTYAHSREAYESTIGYLEQEGLFDRVPYAFVDSGWTGTLQQTLNLLIHSRKPDVRPEGYYFGLYELPAGEREGYHAFYFTPERGLYRKAHFCNCLFECVFSAPDAMTCGYYKHGERYEAMTGTPNPNKAGMEKNSVTLKYYLKAYINASAGEKDAADGVKLAEKLLTRFMARPERFEAGLYGGYLFSDDVLEGGLKRAAAELSAEEIRQHNFFARIFSKLGLYQKDAVESAWIEGSIVINGSHVRRYLRHALCYKYFVYIRKTWKGLSNAKCSKKR